MAEISCLRTICVYFQLSFFKFVCFERERREGENSKQVPHCQRRALLGLELMNREIMTWTKIKSQTLTRLSHPGAPVFFLLINWLTSTTQVSWIVFWTCCLWSWTQVCGQHPDLNLRSRPEGGLSFPFAPSQPCTCHLSASISYLPSSCSLLLMHMLDPPRNQPESK